MSAWVTVGVATTAASDGSARSSMRIKDRTAVWFGGFGGAGGIDIENPGQGRVFGGVNDSKMIAAEGAGSQATAKSGSRTCIQEANTA